jgi:D-serine deaminase-like pyridoxal phosphate-dependent protein
MAAIPRATDPALQRVATPCFVVWEAAVMHNLALTAAACGGVQRLMPHVKTHRAPWVVRLLREHGIAAFKAATPAEVEMILESGATDVTWAYPTLEAATIGRVLAACREHPEATVTAMLDSPEGRDLWLRLLPDAPPRLRLRIDLDSGLGRTGLPIDEAAIAFARPLAATGRLVGWHVYDGEVRDDDIEVRRREVAGIAARIAALQRAAAAAGLPTDTIAASSYTFDLWPRDVLSHVTPGTWVYSQARHERVRPEMGWHPAAFVLASVMSTRAGTATLDAGFKGVSTDPPLAERFRWPGRIHSMSEEHSVVEAGDLVPGERVLLLAGHICTTAYLYQQALVKPVKGDWEWRPQLGGRR